VAVVLDRHSSGQCGHYSEAGMAYPASVNVAVAVANLDDGACSRPSGQRPTKPTFYPLLSRSLGRHLRGRSATKQLQPPSTANRQPSPSQPGHGMGRPIALMPSLRPGTPAPSWLWRAFALLPARGGGQRRLHPYGEAPEWPGRTLTGRPPGHLWQPTARPSSKDLCRLDRNRPEACY